MPERQMREKATYFFASKRKLAFVSCPLAIKRHVCTWVFREVCDHLPKRMPAEGKKKLRYWKNKDSCSDFFLLRLGPQTFTPSNKILRISPRLPFSGDDMNFYLLINLRIRSNKRKKHYLKMSIKR